MTIGGVDFVFPITDRKMADDVIFRTVRFHWPKYAMSDATDDLPAVHPFGSSIPLAPGPEYFIFRDLAADDSWACHGLTDENASQMIHVIHGDARVTVVVGGDDESRQIARELGDRFQHLARG